MAQILVPFSTIPTYGYLQIDGKIYEKIAVLKESNKPYNAYEFKGQRYEVIADDQMVLPIRA